MASEKDIPEIGLNAENLYKDELFSDLAVGAVRRFIPVTLDGETDPERAVIFHGQTALSSPAGRIPLEFVLEAKTLEEAVAAFPKAAQAEGQRTLEELEEMQRKQQSESADNSASRIQMP